MEEALTTAREVGATVALDVNYRAALWSREEASAWVASVLPRIDVLSAGVDDLVAVGVEVLKLFPAGPLGIPYLNALLGPFRAAAFVPTGGTPSRSSRRG